jgi:hypothetical protein
VHNDPEKAKAENERIADFERAGYSTFEDGSIKIRSYMQRYHRKRSEDSPDCMKISIDLSCSRSEGKTEQNITVDQL